MGCEFGKVVCEIRNVVCEFRNANFAKLLAMGLRNAQYPAATVPLVLHPAACILSSTASHFLHFSFDFPLIFGLVDG